jgi:hypothetical protein
VANGGDFGAEWDGHAAPAADALERAAGAAVCAPCGVAFSRPARPVCVSYTSRPAWRGSPAVSAGLCARVLLLRCRCRRARWARACCACCAARLGQARRAGLSSARQQRRAHTHSALRYPQGLRRAPRPGAGAGAVAARVCCVGAMPRLASGQRRAPFLPRKEALGLEPRLRRAPSLLSAGISATAVTRALLELSKKSSCMLERRGHVVIQHPFAPS